jgi:hypothetical protein
MEPSPEPDVRRDHNLDGPSGQPTSCSRVDLLPSPCTDDRIWSELIETPQRRPNERGGSSLEYSHHARIVSNQQLHQIGNQRKPPLVYGHKKPRCAVCRLCSHCGCSHDGLSVEFKLSRRVGQHGSIYAAEKLTKRLANTYKPGMFYESPMTPQAPNRAALQLLTRSSTQENKNQQPRVLTTRLFRFPSPADVLRALDLPSLVQHFYKHAPPAVKRSDYLTWQDRDSSTVKAAVRVSKEAIDQTCFLFCDGNRKAGSALWDLTRSVVLGGKGALAIKILTNLIECYAKPQKDRLRSVCFARASLRSHSLTYKVYKM